MTRMAVPSRPVAPAGRDRQVANVADRNDGRSRICRTRSQLLDDCRRTGVRPDSVQVLGGRLSSRLPTSMTGVALFRSALPAGAVAGAWLQRGLPSSQ